MGYTSELTRNMKRSIRRTSRRQTTWFSSVALWLLLFTVVALAAPTTDFEQIPMNPELRMEISKSADAIQEFVQQEYMAGRTRKHGDSIEISKMPPTSAERNQALFDLELGIFQVLSRQQRQNASVEFQMDEGFNFCSRDPNTPLDTSVLCPFHAMVSRFAEWDYEFVPNLEEIYVLYFLPAAGTTADDYIINATSSDETLLADSSIDLTIEAGYFDQNDQIWFYNISTLCSFSNAVGVTNITWVAQSKTSSTRFEFRLRVFVAGMTFTAIYPAVATVDADGRVTFPTYQSTTDTSNMTIVVDLQPITSTMKSNQGLNIANMNIDVSITEYWDQFTWRSDCPPISANRISDVEAVLPADTNCSFGFVQEQDMLAIRFNRYRTGPGSMLTVTMTFKEELQINYVETVYSKELVFSWLVPAPPFYDTFESNETIFSYNGGQLVTMTGYNFYPGENILFYLPQFGVVWGFRNSSFDASSYSSSFVSACTFVTAPAQGMNLDYLITAFNPNTSTGRIFQDWDPFGEPFIVNYATFTPPPNGGGNDVYESVTLVVGVVDTTLAPLLEDSVFLLQLFANSSGVPLNHSLMTNATSTRFVAVAPTRSTQGSEESATEKSQALFIVLDPRNAPADLKQRVVLQGVRATYAFWVLRGLELSTKQDLESYVLSGRATAESGYTIVLIDVNYIIPLEEISSVVSDIAIAAATTAILVVIISAVAAQIASLAGLGSAQIGAISAATTSTYLAEGNGGVSLSPTGHAVTGVEGTTAISSMPETAKPSSVYTIHALQYCAALCQINSDGITEPMLSTCTELSFANLQVTIPFLVTDQQSSDYIEIGPESTSRAVLRTSVVSQYFMEYPQSEFASRNVESFYDLQQSNLTSVFQSQLFLIAVLVSGIITLHIAFYVFFARYKRLRNALMDLFPKFEIIILNVIHMGVYLGGFAILTSNQSQPAGLVIAAVLILFIFGIGYPLFLLLVSYKVVAPHLNKTWLSNYPSRFIARGGWKWFQKIEKVEQEEIQRSWLARDAEDPAQTYWYLETSTSARFSGRWVAATQNKWARRFGEIFEQFKGQYFWYYLAEVIIVSIEGIIIGAFGEHGTVQASVLVALASIDLLLVLWLLPFNDIVELVVQIIVSMLNLSVSILVVISLSLNGNTGLNISKAMVFILITAIVITALYILYATVEAVVLYRRQIADTIKRCWTAMRGREIESGETESDDESDSSKVSSGGAGAVQAVASPDIPAGTGALSPSLLYGKPGDADRADPLDQINPVQTTPSSTSGFDVSGNTLPPREGTDTEIAPENLTAHYNLRSAVGLPADG